MNDQAISFLRRRILVRHHPSAFLLGAQLLSLLLYAAYDGMHSGRALLGAFSVIVLALAVWVVSRSPATNWIAWMIAIPAFLLSLLSAMVVDPHLLVWSSLLKAALYFYTAGSLIAYMMGDHRVTTDELFAAGATFTLIAWGFAYVYLVCQAWYPGSFVGVARPGEPRTFRVPLSELHQSFSSRPRRCPADKFASTRPGDARTIAGVAYIAVVVSRL